MMLKHEGVMSWWRDSLCFTLAVAILGSAVNVSAQGPGDRPELGLRTWNAPSADALEVRGMAIDGETGQGLVNAQVYLRSTSVGVLADDTGAFVLKAPAPGSYTLAVDLIGYRSVAEKVDVPAAHGIEVQVATVPQQIGGCEIICTWPGCESGVRVEVRDIKTGLAPQVPVTLKVSAGGRSASSSGVAPALDSVYLASHRFPGDEARGDSITAQLPVRLFTGGRLGSDEPLDVQVTAEGYYPWEAEGVWIFPRDCLPAVSRLLKVWLQPIDRPIG